MTDDINVRGLFRALEFGNFAGANELVDDFGVSVEAAMNRFPMTFAAIRGGEDVLNWLKERGLGVDAFIPDENGDPPEEEATLLEWAVLNGNIDITELALDQGADPNFMGRSMLLSAAIRNQASIAILLINHGADVNYGMDSTDEESPLEMAFAQGNLIIAKPLIMAGAGSRGVPGGGTLIHFFLRSKEGRTNEGHAQTLEWLITGLGIDPNTPNPDGVLPLHIAIVAGEWDLAEVLVENGADLDSPVVGFGDDTTRLYDLVIKSVRNNTSPSAVMDALWRARKTWEAKSARGSFTKRALYSAPYSALFG